MATARFDWRRVVTAHTKLIRARARPSPPVLLLSAALFVCALHIHRNHLQLPSDTSENRNPRAAIEGKWVAIGFYDKGLQGEKLDFDFDTTGMGRRWTAVRKFGT